MNTDRIAPLTPSRRGGVRYAGQYDRRTYTSGPRFPQVPMTHKVDCPHCYARADFDGEWTEHHDERCPSVTDGIAVPRTAAMKWGGLDYDDLGKGSVVLTKEPSPEFWAFVEAGASLGRW